MVGQLHLIIGPMFAGKSTELIRLTNVYTAASKRCLLLKHANDTRYDRGEEEKSVCTHDGCRKEAIAIDRFDTDFTVKYILPGVDVIAVDEAHFFPADNLARFCHDSVARGITVILAGLHQTFNLAPMRTITDLTGMAEKITKLTAICIDCKGDGYFVHKKIKDDTRVVGGAELYETLCRECYTKKDVPFSSNDYVGSELSRTELLYKYDTPPGGQMPLLEYATDGAAGLDLCSPDNYTIPSNGGTVVVDMGIMFQVPKNCYGRLAIRSSLAAQNIFLNGGVIDSDYRGKIKVLLTNFGTVAYEIEAHERFCQLIIEKIERPKLRIVEKLDDTKRAAGGFGSTGNAFPIQGWRLEKVARRCDIYGKYANVYGKYAN